MVGCCLPTVTPFFLGIAVLTGGQIVLSGSTVQNNFATLEGGGVYLAEGYLKAFFTTFAGVVQELCLRLTAIRTVPSSSAER